MNAGASAVISTIHENVIAKHPNRYCVKYSSSTVDRRFSHMYVNGMASRMQIGTLKEKKARFKFELNVMSLTYVIQIWLINCGHVDLFVCCVRELNDARLMASLDKKINVLSSSNSRTFIIPKTSRPTRRTMNAFMPNVIQRHRI